MGENAKPDRKRVWRWVLIFAVYLFVSVFLDNWIVDQFNAAISALVAIGGYWLSNVAVGLLAGTVCYVLHITHKRRLSNQLLRGDPDPLPDHYDYVTQAQAELWFGWFGGVLLWTTGLTMLFFWYPAAWVFGPIVGTTAILSGYTSVSHARKMDAQRGDGRGGGGTAPGHSPRH